MKAKVRDGQEERRVSAARLSKIGRAAKLSEIGRAAQLSEIGRAAKLSKIGRAARLFEIGRAARLSEIRRAARIFEIGRAARLSDGQRINARTTLLHVTAVYEERGQKRGYSVGQRRPGLLGGRLDSRATHSIDC